MEEVGRSPQGRRFPHRHPGFLTTEHGHPLAVNRIVVHAELKDAWKGRLQVTVLGAFTRQERPCGIVGAMSRSPEDAWLSQDDWAVTVNPRILRGDYVTVA